MRLPHDGSFIGARDLTMGLWAAVMVVIGGCSPDELQAPKVPQARIPIAASVAPTSGLVGEWKLDETNGTIAVDTKNGFNADVLGGAAFVAGKLGNALNFNNGTAGTGGKYAEMPSNPTLDTVQKSNYTLSAWFFPYTNPANDTVDNRNWAIVVKYGKHMGLVYENGQTFSARHYLIGDVPLAASSPATYALNTWHHVAEVVSKTAGTVKLYVNGALVATTSFAANTATRDYGTTPFRIGKAQHNWSANGKVDQVRIYNRDLSAAEVADLFNETAGGGGTAPTVTTKPASAIGTTTATLNGSADPNGAATSGWFRYATTNPGTCNDTFGTRVPATGGTALGAGTSPVAYSRPITGLTVGQGYYFCAIAKNSLTGVGTVRFFVPVRFAVGMFKGQGADVGRAPTPDGQHGAVGANLPQLLANAKAAGARITLRVTSNNDLLQDPADGSFDMAKWKSDFDRVANYADSLRKYVKDGTFIGHYALDEPYQDFTNFQAADLEEICRYQKLSWPFVPCIVRINNIKLDSVTPAGGWKYVDAGWAQLADQGFDKPPFNGSFRAWYDSNLVAGRRRGLGLMYGFNFLQGGHEETPAPGGCDLPPPSSPANCAMTAAEIRKMADAISAIGPDQGCGDIGWQLNTSPGSERDYYFGTGAYAGNGMQAALQYLWDKTAGAGLRPGLCNIRGDLPPP